MNTMIEGMKMPTDLRNKNCHLGHRVFEWVDSVVRDPPLSVRLIDGEVTWERLLMLASDPFLYAEFVMFCPCKDHVKRACVSIARLCFDHVESRFDWTDQRYSVQWIRERVARARSDTPVKGHYKHTNTMGDVEWQIMQSDSEQSDLLLSIAHIAWRIDNALREDQGWRPNLSELVFYGMRLSRATRDEQFSLQLRRLLERWFPHRVLAAHVRAAQYHEHADALAHQYTALETTHR